MPLTPKQQRFVREYLIDLNATAAYRRAGYESVGSAAEANASRLMRNDKVAAAIEAAMQAREGRTEITADRVLREVARIALSDVRKLFAADGSLRPVRELDDDAAAALAAVDVVEDFAGGKTTKKVRLWDKKGALELLGRHLGLFAEKLKVEAEVKAESPVDVTKLTDDQLRQLVAALAPALRPAGGPD